MSQRWAPASGTNQRWAPGSGTNQRWAPGSGSTTGALLAAFQAATVPDTAAPRTVTLAAPRAGDSLSQSTVLIATATDNRDGWVEQVLFYLDDTEVGQGAPVVARDGTVTYQFEFDTTQGWVTDGDHQISVTAIDNAGNAAASTPVAVTITNSAAPIFFPFTGDQILDFAGGSSLLTYTFDWQIVRPSGVLGPRLRPWQDAPPTIQHQTTQTTMRTVQGLKLLGADLADVDLGQDELQVYMRLATGDRWPCGRFVFADHTHVPYSFGEDITINLFDRAWLLDQGIERSISLQPGDNMATLILSLCAEFGVTDISIDSSASTAVVGAPTAWPPGTHAIVVITDICKALGCYPPHFDSVGTLIIMTVPVIATAPFDREYNTGGRTIDGTTTVTDNTYQAPNRYVVVGGSQAPVVGWFDVPPEAPQSQAKRKKLIVETIQLSSVATQAAAQAAAIAAYVRDTRSFRTVSFNSPCDPRHGVYDIIGIDGVPHLETAWSMNTGPGGLMTHTLSRIWQGSAA